jgi:hypothetical protein
MYLLSSGLSYMFIHFSFFFHICLIVPAVTVLLTPENKEKLFPYCCCCWCCLCCRRRRRRRRRHFLSVPFLLLSHHFRPFPPICNLYLLYLLVFSSLLFLFFSISHFCFHFYLSLLLFYNYIFFLSIYCFLSFPVTSS